MHFLLRWGINTVSLLLTSYLVKGIVIANFRAALLAALLLGLVNAFIKPIIMILTLPLNILTLGLLTLVINGLLLSFVAWAIPGFTVVSIGWAILGAVILSIISTVLSILVVN
jgi:putative membrane protein